MDTRELLTAIRDTIANDQALRAWCNAEFGSGPTVCLGIDDNNKPKPEDYPVVAVVGVEQIRGQAGRENLWIVELGVAVRNEEIKVSGNILTRTGFLQAETLRELAEDAVYRARILPPETQGESSSYVIHPVYASHTILTIHQAASSRKGLPG